MRMMQEKVRRERERERVNCDISGLDPRSVTAFRMDPSLPVKQMSSLRAKDTRDNSRKQRELKCGMYSIIPCNLHASL